MSSFENAFSKDETVSAERMREIQCPGVRQRTDVSTAREETLIVTRDGRTRGGEGKPEISGAPGNARRKETRGRTEGNEFPTENLFGHGPKREAKRMRGREVCGPRRVLAT